MTSYRALITATVIGVMVAVAAGFVIGSEEARVSEAAFESEAADSLLAITGEMNASSDVLDTLRRFVELDDAPPTRTAFQAFAKRSRMRVPALRDSGYAARVAGADRPRFEEEARRDGAPGFSIREPDASGASRPAPPQEVYFPIFYPDPVEIAPRVLGLNLTFEPQRREAIARAIATGRPAATPPLHIVTADGPIGGFMSFLPVYRPGGAPGTPSGLVYGVFEIGPMVENVLKKTLRSNEIDVLFFDPAKHGEPIYWHPAASRTADLPRPTLAEAFALPHWTGTLDMAGQSWGVLLMPQHVAGGLWSRWSTLAATAVALLLTALVDIYLVVSRRHTVALVRLTADLQATARSLTEKSERLSYLAHHDVLTGLPNRGSLMARLESRLSDPAVSCVAVASLDLDGFKAVNDTYGHAAGDALLVAVAARLRSAAGEEGFVARFGGDEFVLLCEPGPGGSAVDVLCRRAIEALSAPFDLLGIPMSVGASIGVALAPADGTTLQDFLKNADSALYRAKAERRGSYRLFDPRIDPFRQPGAARWANRGRGDGLTDVA